MEIIYYSEVFDKILTIQQIDADQFIVVGNKKDIILDSIGELYKYGYDNQLNYLGIL